jgi:uncharacterized protein YcbX
MNQPDPARVTGLYRYPVKGFSAEPLRSVALEPGATLPADRRFAVENGPSGFDPSAPKWQPKIKFLCLMRNAKLASLQTRYEDRTGVFTLSRNGAPLAEASLHDASGRAAIEMFLEEFMGREARGPLRVIEAPNHSFSDVAAKVVHIINLASLRDLETSIGRKVHPLRFRANLYVDGLAPWSEFELLGKKITAGGVTMKVIKRTERCAATEVDPQTAERDIDIPEALWRKTGDQDCGVYASVIAGGTLAVGDRVVAEV